MQRFFIISLTDLDFEKMDLNIPFSEKRLVIGKLSRIVTNAIFLSHSLREDIFIRIFVEKPVSHIIQINSSTIRYLGPELRSLASLILKAKKKFQEAMENNYFKTNDWLETNPGFFIKLANNPFQNLPITGDLSSHLVHVILDDKNKNSEVKKYSLKELDLLIHKLSLNGAAFILSMALTTNTNILDSLNDQNFVVTKIRVSKKLDLARLTTIVNLILDKIK